MPLFIDIHRNVDGLTAESVAEAHDRDVAVQAKHGARFLRYWFDEATGMVICFSEAPSAEAAAAVHIEAQGAPADEIVQVREGR